MWDGKIKTAKFMLNFSFGTYDFEFRSRRGRHFFLCFSENVIQEAYFFNEECLYFHLGWCPDEVEDSFGVGELAAFKLDISLSRFKATSERQEIRSKK